MLVPRHPGRRLTAAAILALLLLLAVALAAGPLAAAAEAGTFTVRTCRGSANQTVPVGDGGYGWQPATLGAWAGNGSGPVNRCDVEGDGLAAFNDRSVVRQADTGVGWVYGAAPGTSISAYKLWMLAGVRPLGNDPDGAVVVQTAPFVGYDQALGVEGLGGVAGTDDLTGPPWVDVSGRNSSAVQVWAICGGLPGTTCAGGEPNLIDSYMRIYKAQMTTTDGSAPSVSVASGDAIGRSLWHGPQLVAFNATDAGSGVYRVLMQAGASVGSLVTRSTQVLDANGGRCQDENPANDDPYEFTSPQPCPSSVSSDVQFDSAALVDGSQLVRIQVEDAAGNRTTVYGPVTKTADNLPPTVGPVTVSGPAAREGETVACAAAVQGQGPAITFRWLRSKADGSDVVEIPGAVGATYVLGATDVGAKVRCELTAADEGGRASGTSTLTDGPFANGAVVIAGVPPAVVIQPGDGTAGAVPGRGTVGEAARVDQNVVPVSNPTGGSGRNGTPADDEAVVVAYFERGSGKRRIVSGTATAGMKERLRIRGTLKTHDGRPIAGAKVFLAQRGPTGTWKVDGGTVSRADGSLLMFTRKGGTTRPLRLVYFPRDGRDANRGSATLTLKLRQSAVLSLSRTRLHNRGTLRFTGRVDGVVVGRGPRVQVQVKLPAGWSTFASTRATKARHGRFAVPYRFLRTTRRTVYRFRVRVVPTAASGYVGGTSRARAVVVLP